MASCKKKLPELASDYESNFTEFVSTQLETFDTCTASLVEGQAEFLDTIPRGGFFSSGERVFEVDKVKIDEGFDDLEIVTQDYSSTNRFKLVYKNASLLEIKRYFGKRIFKYSKDGNTEGAPAFSFASNNAYSSCFDGELFVEYLDSSVVYSFCNVKFNSGNIVNSESNIVEIAGKFEVTLHE